MRSTGGCELRLDRSQHHLPRFDVAESLDLDAYFRATVEKGFEERRSVIEAGIGSGRCLRSLDEYRERLKKRIDAILPFAVLVVAQSTASPK